MITSISRNLAQQIVDNIHAVCGYHVNFINTNGMIYASSDPDRLNTYHDIGRESARTGETIEVESDEQFPGTHKGINIPVFHHMRVIAVVGISGDPSEVRRFAKLAERIASLLLHEQELNAAHRTSDEKKQYMIRSLIYSEFENMDYLRECFREFKITEGEDTLCEVKYKPYSGNLSFMILSEGDRIAVISSSALPSREQIFEVRGIRVVLDSDIAVSQLMKSCAKLGIRVLHAKPRNCEAKGVIEKFHQVVDGFIAEVRVAHVHSVEELNEKWKWNCFGMTPGYTEVSEYLQFLSGNSEQR
ncbi:MAG: hypothetical protein K6E91_07630 [Butyrivibrio sp.]|nr:hypothetical protein [Butyrivibrio sp.]